MMKNIYQLKLQSVFIWMAALLGGVTFGQVYELSTNDLLYASGVSDNGVVVLSSNAANFMWTESGGLTTISTISNGYDNAGNPAISNDGTKISGTVTNPDTNLNGMGLYDVVAGTWTYLDGIGGDMDGSTASAWSISGDGSTVVGLGWLPPGSGGNAHAVKWTQADGTIDMGSTVAGSSSRANSVNHDGSVIVGWQDAENGSREAAIWRNGVQSLITDADGNAVSEAGAVSGDGNWVIGGGMEAWRWSESTGLQSISHPDAGMWFTGAATAISADGSVIVGYYRPWPGAPFGGEGFIWTEETGRVELNEYVSNLGIDDLGITFALPLGISADGTMIVGTGLNATGDASVAFLIKLSGDLNVSDLESSSLTYYPNPVKDILNISSKKSIQNVSVYNMAGQQVSNNLEVSGNQVNVSSLPSGVYVFRVKLEGNQVETFKIVKK